MREAREQEFGRELQPYTLGLLRTHPDRVIRMLNRYNPERGYCGIRLRAVPDPLPLEAEERTRENEARGRQTWQSRWGRARQMLFERR